LAVIEAHRRFWGLLVSFLDCNGQGLVDSLANLLFVLVMLFAIPDKSNLREFKQQWWRPE